MATHVMAGPSEEVSVAIAGFAFVPDVLTISAGTEVTFVNLDFVSHTVTAGSDDQPRPDLFDSGSFPEGDEYSVAFDQAGTYTYFCEIHPAMEGSITVKH